MRDRFSAYTHLVATNAIRIDSRNDYFDASHWYFLFSDLKIGSKAKKKLVKKAQRFEET